jgi:hypothetical protein
VTTSYALAAVSMLGCAFTASLGSQAAVLVAFTAAAFFATCAWVSAYPMFSELFPTHLRATGIGASVGVGRTGAILGQVLLAEAAGAFQLASIFALLGGFWLIGATAGVLWWRHGIEARGLTLEALTTALHRRLSASPRDGAIRAATDRHRVVARLQHVTIRREPAIRGRVDDLVAPRGPHGLRGGGAA